ncbi:hypothetical protein ACQF36_11680 [Streptomyces sp. Marseille-Q5077]|uniref:hypothetical protein n=1 Tax=Streptomyces sp. Marseille-Q5077 TaxID=3418995 RepID=UPI003D0167EC
MHDPAAQHGDMTFDFGVTELGTSFHQDWTRYAGTVVEHVHNSYGFEGDPGRVLLLIEDLLRLRDSRLDGRDLHLLWSTTDDGGSPWILGRERAWLDELLAAVVPLAQTRDASPASCTTYPACVPDGTSPAAAEHQLRTPEVVDLVALLNQQGDDHIPLPDMRAALIRCAETVCAELAFRFLLRATRRYWMPLTPQIYTRLENLGNAFGYGPHVVDGVANLVE